MQHFISTGIKHTNFIFLVNSRGKIKDKYQMILKSFGLTNEGDDTLLCIQHVNPFESLAALVDLVKSRLGAIDPIQIFDQFLHFSVDVISQQVPVQGLRLCSFLPLGKIISHKEQFFTGMTIHIGVEESQTRKLLPVVSRRLVYKRLFLVYHHRRAAGPI